MRNLKKHLKTVAQQNPETTFVFRYQDMEQKYVFFLEDKLDKIDIGTKVGLGVHAFSPEGYMGFSSTDNLSSESIQETVNKSLSSLEIARNSNFEKVPGLFKVDPLKQRKISPNYRKETEISDVKKILKTIHTRIGDVETPGGVEYTVKQRFVMGKDKRWTLRNTNEEITTDVEFAYPYFGYAMIISAKSKDNSLDLYITRDFKGFDEIKRSEQIDSIISEYSYLTDLMARLLDAPKIQPGHYKIIMGGKVGSTFIHEAFGHTVEADTIRLESPLAEDGKLKEGLKVAEEYVNVLEGTDEFGWGYNPYSSYGGRRKEIKIVEKGKLKHFISDISHFKDSPNNYSRAGSYKNLPFSRMSFTRLEVEDEATFDFDLDISDTSAEKIYNKLLSENIVDKDEKVVFLFGNSGGQVKTDEGSFQLNSNATFLFHKGDVKLYRGTSFSGKTLSVLHAIESASSDVTVSGGGWCGKFNQRVRVKSSAPTLTILKKDKSIKIA